MSSVRQQLPANLPAQRTAAAGAAPAPPPIITATPPPPQPPPPRLMCPLRSLQTRRNKRQAARIPQSACKAFSLRQRLWSLLVITNDGRCPGHNSSRWQTISELICGGLRGLFLFGPAHGGGLHKGGLGTVEHERYPMPLSFLEPAPVAGGDMWAERVGDREVCPIAGCPFRGGGGGGGGVPSRLRQYAGGYFRVYVRVRLSMRESSTCG